MTIGVGRLHMGRAAQSTTNTLWSTARYSALLLGSCLVLSAAASAEPVKVQIYSDFNSMDPAQIISYVVDSALYDRLFSLSADQKILPALASSWTSTSDTVVAKIKPNATCADGTKLTPSVVASSLKRLGASETKAPYAYRTLGTAGYSVEANDEADTVTIKTNAPFSDLLLGLAMPWAGIVCPDGLNNPDIANKPYGSGPYVIDEARSLRGDHYMLVARKGYDWGPGGMTTADAGVPQEILVRVMTNNTTVANELTTGGLDIGLVTGLDERRLEHNPRLTVKRVPTYGMQMLLMQHSKNSPTSDPVVRQAIATAVDRNLVNRAATQGSGTPAISYISEIVPCYDPKMAELYPKPSAAAAKQVLMDGGWKAGTDGIMEKAGRPLTIRLIGGSALSGSAPEYLLEAVREMGANVQLRNITVQEQISVLTSDDWDAELWAFSPPMPSPNIISTLVVPGGGNNYSKIDNQDFMTEQRAALASAPDDPKRCQHWIAAQRSLLKKWDILPLFAPVYAFYATKGITFNMYAPLSPDLTSIRIKR